MRGESGEKERESEGRKENAFLWLLSGAVEKLVSFLRCEAEMSLLKVEQ